MTRETSKNLSLYDLAEEVASLDQLFLAEHGEETPELKALHEEVNKVLETKTDSYVGYAMRLEDEIALAKKRQDELKHFINARKAAIERLKTYVHYFFQSTKRDRLDGDLYTIAQQPGRESLVVESEDNIPHDFIKTTVAVDKIKLNKAIKAGLKPPEGVSYLKGAPSIRFKPKPVNRARKKETGAKDE